MKHFEWEGLYWFLGIMAAFILIGTVAFFVHLSVDASARSDAQKAQTVCNIPKISVLKGTTITIICGGIQ